MAFSLSDCLIRRHCTQLRYSIPAVGEADRDRGRMRALHWSPAFRRCRFYFVLGVLLKCSYYITGKGFIALLTARINVMPVSHTLNLKELFVLSAIPYVVNNSWIACVRACVRIYLKCNPALWNKPRQRNLALILYISNCTNCLCYFLTLWFPVIEF